MDPSNHVLDRLRSPMRGGNFEGRKAAMSCAKTAEPIEMPFGIWTRVGPRKHVLGGGAH